jgi:hypothetical protein
LTRWIEAVTKLGDLSQARGSAGGAGCDGPVKAWAPVSLAELRAMDEGSALGDQWITAVRARWAAARATAPAGGSDGAAWPDGDAARAAACHASLTPIVTGEVDIGALDDLVRLCVQLDRLDHAAGHSEAGAGTAASEASPLPRPAWPAVLLCFIHHQIIIHRWAWTPVLNPDGTTTAWNPDRTKVLHSHSPPPGPGNVPGSAPLAMSGWPAPAYPHT